MAINGASNEAQHLCVLVHGLWGNPNHMATISRTLREKHPEEALHILVATRNSGSFTYDGIELGGERVCQEIEEEIDKLTEEGQKITKISLCGYSLGGLVARYAVGLLYSKGFFETIQPVNFTTFATPHLGVRTPLRGWHNHIWNVLGARTLSASGRQLFTIDKFRDTGKPLLEILADPDSIFIKGLAQFERRTLYTNIVNDKSAVFYTTGISTKDPFADLDTVKINYLKGFEDVILNPETPVTPCEAESPDSTLYAALVRNGQATLGRIPFLLTMICFIPIGVVAFLINSGVQSLRSHRRIRLHERGLAGIQPGNYRVPLLITNMREAVEDVYGNLNSAQSHEYLDPGIEEEAGSEGLNPPVIDGARSHMIPRASGSLSLEDEEKDDIQPPDTPTLALAPYQFRMVQALNHVGFRKFPVYIHKVRHSHAAIIVRVEKPSFSEGYIVLRHWLDKEFIL